MTINTYSPHIKSKQIYSVFVILQGTCDAERAVAAALKV